MKDGAAVVSDCISNGGDLEINANKGEEFQLMAVGPEEVNYKEGHIHTKYLTNYLTICTICRQRQTGRSNCFVFFLKAKKGFSTNGQENIIHRVCVCMQRRFAKTPS